MLTLKRGSLQACLLGSHEQRTDQRLDDGNRAAAAMVFPGGVRARAERKENNSLIAVDKGSILLRTALILYSNRPVSRPVPLGMNSLLLFRPHGRR